MSLDQRADRGDVVVGLDVGGCQRVGGDESATQVPARGGIAGDVGRLGQDASLTADMNVSVKMTRAYMASSIPVRNLRASG